MGWCSGDVKCGAIQWCCKLRDDAVALRNFGWCNGVVKLGTIEWCCDIWDDAVGVVKLWMIQQRFEFWDVAVVFLNYMIQWCYEIWDDTVTLWNVGWYSGVVKLGMIQWCSEIWNDRNDTVVLNKVKYNGFVKYGKKTILQWNMVRYNTMQQPYYCNIDQQNGTTCFDLRGVNISFITYCSALVSSACTYVWVIWSDEANVLMLTQWTKKVLTLKFV